MKNHSATAADIAARINELKTELTANRGYNPSIGQVTWVLTDAKRRQDAERELADAQHVYLPAAQAREVQA